MTRAGSARRFELRQLEAFVAVHDAGSFAAAAEKLGVAQPTVSLLVRRLEERLDLQLFDRTSRSVTATATGFGLLGPARQLLAASIAVTVRADELREGRQGRVRIATTDGIAGPLRVLLERLRHEKSDLDVALERTRAADKLRRIVDGTLDAAFVRQAPATPGIARAELWREPLLALVRATSPHAHAPLDLGELAHAPMLVTPAQTNPGVFAAMLGHARRAGFEPVLGPPLDDWQNALVTIAGSDAWTLIGASNAPQPATGVAAVALADAEATVAIELIWRATGASPPAQTFIRVARALAHEQAYLRALVHTEVPQPDPASR